MNRCQGDEKLQQELMSMLVFSYHIYGLVASLFVNLPIYYIPSDTWTNSEPQCLPASLSKVTWANFQT